MAQGARVEAAGDVEHDAPGARRGCRALGSHGIAGRRHGRRLRRVLARATRREEAQGETRQLDALHGSGEDLTRVAFWARTSMTNCERFPS